MNPLAWLGRCCSRLFGLPLRQIRPGVTTLAEVQTRMGQPSGRFTHPDGSITLEYSRQPAGVTCHMITCAPDQRVVRVEQVLNETTFARIRTGQSRDEVRQLLGRPATIQTFSLKNEEVWDWHFQGDIPMDEWHFYVHFDTASGQVVRTSRGVEMRG